MTTAATTTTQKIREYSREAPEGTVLAAKELLHLGSRAAVDQALSRLSRAGELERIGRGLYVRPVETRFGKRLPELGRLIAEISKRTGETIVPSGAAAANRLGLTTQVPLRQIFLTSGPTRCLELRSQKVELRHAARKHLAMPDEPAGDALRVLTHWAEPSQMDTVLEKIRETLTEAELKALLAHRSLLTTPAAKALSRLAPHG